MSESNTSGGFLIEGARDVHLASCHAAINGGPGYKVTGGDSVQIYDSLAYQNNEEGIILTGGRGLEVAGCVCSNNGQTANNTYDGIAVGSGISSVRISHNRSGDFLLTLTNKQRYGLSVATSTDYINVIANELSGNQTAEMLSTSTGGNNVIIHKSQFTTNAGTLYVGTAQVIATDPGNGGEVLRVGGHARFNGYIKTEGSNGQLRLDNRNSSNSSMLNIYNQDGTAFRFGNASTNSDYAVLTKSLWAPVDAALNAELGSAASPWGRIIVGTGTAIKPSSTVSSELSLGWYRSAASVMALSYGGLDMPRGTNASFGTALLSVGSIKVSTTYIATGDVVMLTSQGGGTFANLGALEVNGITSGTSFAIASTSATDNNVVAWWIIKSH